MEVVSSHQYQTAGLQGEESTSPAEFLYDRSINEKVRFGYNGIAKSRDSNYRYVIHLDLERDVR